MRYLTAIVCALVLPSLAACAAEPAGSASASEAFTDSALNTDDHEVVCQLDDFLATKVFVDRDRDHDRELGKLSSKILEMPTENAHSNNFKLFQVELLTVERARCPDCADTQVILYKAAGEAEIINKLEVTRSHAKLTQNVDADGAPRAVSFISEGPCKPNEVE